MAFLAPPLQSARGEEGFRRWLEGLWPEARDFGISRTTFDSAFRGVHPDPRLPDLAIAGRRGPGVKGQAEFIKTPQDYLSKTYLTTLAERGKGLLAEHAQTLMQVEREVGVERHVVLAIWGRETAYGTHRLPHSALRVLATQAYLGRRKDLFRKELLYALRLLEERVAAPETLRSSWAGAIGLTQFMPSDYYRSAYDLDKDGRKDIWNSVPDALASAANQLKQKGWVAGQTWGYEVRLSPQVDCALEGPLNARSVSEWVRLGLRPAHDLRFRADQLEPEAYLMMPGGAYGPAFLALENFKVIRRYNQSDLYAVFVGHLADRIAGGGDFETPWRNVSQVAPRDIEDIQRRLQVEGYAVDKIDGKIGSNTRAQIGAYQKAHGLRVDCWPSEALLKNLRTLASR
ncbi:MAG TPA: lytic murein transglycosylase [Hyphomicrobiaceae bacterium]|nr:lytic murein transglycosylase [Hyphomicrobiaceae bacterium]